MSFKKREKFNLSAKIKDLNLDPRVSDLLESTRPLTNASLLKVSNNIDKIAETMETVKKRVSVMDPSFWLAVGIGFAGSFTEPWSNAVCRGIAHRMYTGEYTQQDAYSVLCQAAGSCLKAPSAEPFRLVLSLITKAGLRPPKFDESNKINVPVSLPPKKWQDLADVYASLEEVKGSRIVESLAVGVGCLLLEGEVNHKTASRLFKTAYPWRSSSPVPQLLRGETRC